MATQLQAPFPVKAFTRVFWSHPVDRSQEIEEIHVLWPHWVFSPDNLRADCDPGLPGCASH